MMTRTGKLFLRTLGWLLLALPLLLLACGTVPGTVTPAATITAVIATRTVPSPTPASELRQCGVEVMVTSKPFEGKDAVARDCLWQAYQAGQPARFTTTAITVEGDPITFDITLVGPRWITVTVTSADTFGMRGVFPHRCGMMERQPAQSGVAGDPAGFRLSDCDHAGRGFVTDTGYLYVP